MNPPITGPDATESALREPGTSRDGATAHRLSPITPVEQAKRVQAFEEVLQEFDLMPDNDPPGAWEEAMRDLDAQRPHRKLFEGIL
jgi:hypothetical protein